MPYTQYSLASLTSQISVMLDDQSQLYWSAEEIKFAIWEGLRVWGAVTSYWRGRGMIVAQSSPWTQLIPWASSNYPWTAVPAFYDLSALLPTLRPRTVTLNQMVKDIQYACLEQASGISGAGASGQISVASILRAVQRARNRFVIAARFPYSINPILASPPPSDGLVAFPNTVVYVHRAAWQNLYSSTWTNLWREDAWSIDRADPYWITTPQPSPSVYSESELSPLKLQLAPAPTDEGVVEALTVESLQVDITNPLATFNIPDEWSHAIKWAAIADIFSAESQNSDPLRAKYAEMRFEQAMDLAKMATSITRIVVEGSPVALDSLAAIDAANPFWRNQASRPTAAGCLYDMFAFDCLADRAYGVAVDVVQSAPIPLTDPDYVPLGAEDITTLLDYVTHILTFKCGGKNLEASFDQYDDFMEAASSRGRINAAKIRYLRALFNQPSVEQAARPDRVSKQGMVNA